MSDKNKLTESVKKAKEAVDQANAALNDLIEELDDETLKAINGAGDENPLNGVNRTPDSEIDDPMRPNFGIQDAPPLS